MTGRPAAANDTTAITGDDVLAAALGWRDAGTGVALATVVSTWGSAPRLPGAQMAVTADGRFAGSVSGGCVEGAVIEAAQACIGGAPPQLMDFSIGDDQAWAVGLACGGRLEVWVERLD